MNILRYAARYARGTVLWAVVFGTVGGALTAWIVALVGETLRTGVGTSTQMLTFAADDAAPLSIDLLHVNSAVRRSGAWEATKSSCPSREQMTPG